MKSHPHVAHFHLHYPRLGRGRDLALILLVEGYHVHHLRVVDPWPAQVLLVGVEDSEAITTVAQDTEGDHLRVGIIRLLAADIAVDRLDDHLVMVVVIDLKVRSQDAEMEASAAVTDHTVVVQGGEATAEVYPDLGLDLGLGLLIRAVSREVGRDLIVVVHPGAFRLIDAGGDKASTVIVRHCTAYNV